MIKLTEKQYEVLNYIKTYINRHSYPPTIREIAGHFAISPKGAFDHVAALKKKKRLKMLDHGSRTLELVEEDNFNEQDNFEKIQILGDVAAGKRILTEEKEHGFIWLHKTMLKARKRYFALKVRGDSMKDIGVMEGDTVIIEQRETAKNGDIVVVDLDDGGRALKRFYRQTHRIKLQSENPAYQPIYCTEVHILGRLAGVYRTY
ncbi:MAG: transcriptional repressor LexA [Spirochaetaceae bacterium]|jgi:repressor LexA|nr:transcriptional repressor LexA [Spirochaetaceae bacterium]